MLKLVSINIEGNKHLGRVENFVQAQNPDVVCFQEATKESATLLEELSYHTTFLPLTLKPGEVATQPEGLVIASKHPLQTHAYYYHGEPGELLVFEKERHYHTQCHAILLAAIEHEGATYHVGTTHFTWHSKGEVASEEQTADMEAFTKIVTTLPPHSMCGDFNITRNINPLYDTLCEIYQDNIPASYKSSLDASLHRLGSDPEKSLLFESFMVDYLFTQVPYKAADVRLEFGVSDHAAIVGTLAQ